MISFFLFLFSLLPNRYEKLEKRGSTVREREGESERESKLSLVSNIGHNQIILNQSSSIKSSIHPQIILHHTLGIKGNSPGDSSASPLSLSLLPLLLSSSSSSSTLSGGVVGFVVVVVVADDGWRRIATVLKGGWI